MPENLMPPRETSMVSLPDYRVEPPDVLQIEVQKLIPRPPYHIESYDVLMIRVAGTPLEMPIDGLFLVDAEGLLDLGPEYGRVPISGLSIDQAQLIITQHLRQILREPSVSIQLARTGGTQQVTGTYLIQQDGIVNLQRYGVVAVSGKSLTEVKEAIEKRLAEYFDSPEISVEVVGYNSKKYFVIRENTLEGEDVIDIPITGKETVLDAIGAVGGLARVSSQRVWIARPLHGQVGCEQILPVDYMAITRDGSSATNYQLLPGDRIFIAEDPLIATSNFVNKAVAPVYRILAITQLGSYTVKGLQILGRGYNKNTQF